MNGETYNEKLSSTKTEALFIVLTLVFLSLFAWRWLSSRWDGWAITFVCIFALFLFYVINYRTLKIYITSESLRLTFGIFTWTIAISNIKNCYIDEDTILRFGGAGIHFMWIKGKYRAFFNFLEFPRMVVTLKDKKGLVREIAFTTRHPEQVMRIIQSGLS
jgi:Ca2+/Na+ antiporter